MKAKLLGVAAAGLVLCAVPMLAHHSFSAEYDGSKTIELKGKVTKVEWMNPHARFYVDVTDPAGKVTNWEFELGSPNGLMRQGWTRNSLKIGDEVSVNGARAKDGSNLVNARTVVLADGSRVFGGVASENPDNAKK
jgi:Family of unknown function (DUF6152)